MLFRQNLSRSLSATLARRIQLRALGDVTFK